VTNEPLTVVGGPLLQIVDEGFDQVPFGFLQNGGPAVIGRVGLDEGGIEPVLADQQAETVAEAGLTIAVTVISGGDGIVLFGSDGLRRARRPTEFLDRTEADAIGLAEGAVDGTGLGDAHLGAANQGRNIGGVGVSVTDETFRAEGLIDGRLEDPAANA